MRWFVVFLLVLGGGMGGAAAQALDGFAIGGSMGEAMRLHGRPAAVEPIDGHPAARWALPDGSATSVTADGGTGRIIYVEHDWGRRPGRAPVGLAGLSYGDTLGSIRARFGSNGFGITSNGVSIHEDELTGTNCWEPTGTRGVTLALITAQPLASVDPSHPDTGRGRLVAVILARTSYLAQIWGADRSFDPVYRRVDIGSSIRAR